MTSTPHRIVIVGGGSGGLKLATRLGRRYRRDPNVSVTLVDRRLTHVWKPLLHEVAAGTLDLHDDACDYIAHAQAHGFRFVWGAMDGLEREARQVRVAASGSDDEPATEPGAVRRLDYDTLVIAVGSVSNDFGVPGVAEHCYSLDTADEAEDFRQRLFRAYLQQDPETQAGRPGALDVAIVGAGATGVELAAELDKMRHALREYGACAIDPVEDTRLIILERAPRLLPGLPEELAEATERRLAHLGIETRLGEEVAEVTAAGIRTRSGDLVPATFRVWAAGVAAPAFLDGIDGLQTNARHQLLVESTLQTTRDPSIFAFGDCAACPQGADGRLVPPRAQAADQQAAFLARAIPRHLDGDELPRYRYRDHGALVSVHDSAFGTVMGALLGRVTLEGWIAMMSYRWLYRAHQRALHGTLRSLMMFLSDLVSRRTRPRLKLH